MRGDPSGRLDHTQLHRYMIVIAYWLTLRSTYFYLSTLRETSAPEREKLEKMTKSFADLSQASPPHLKLKISWLLGIYAVVPGCLAIIAADHYLWDGDLARTLPHSPQDLAWFTLFFVLPHIVASSLLLCNREYIRHYSKPLSYGFVACAVLAFLLPLVVPMNLWLLGFGLLTIHHVLAQQFGMATGLSRATGKLATAWKWTGLVAGVLVYYLFYYSKTVVPERAELLFVTTTTVVSVFGVLTGLTFARAANRQVMAYGWLNFAMIAVAYFAIRTEYFFFAVLAPRMIHDLTAFSFYVVHDVNRGREQGRWVFLKFIPIAMVTPVLAILLASSLKSFVALAVIQFLTLFHYWTERFTWKSGTPHRRYVSLSG